MGSIDDYPPVLDTAQVAELLGMNVQMVRRYARKGGSPPTSSWGRTFRFFRDEIFEFLKAHPVRPDLEEEEEEEETVTDR